MLQVWVKTIGKDDDRTVTADKKSGVQQYFWAKDDRSLIYSQDLDGDENFHLLQVDLETKNVRDLTPFQGIRAALVHQSQKIRGRILVTMNLRDRSLFDVYSVELKSGAIELAAENPGDVESWHATDDLAVRGARVVTKAGGTELRVRDTASGPWRTLLEAPAGDNLELIEFSADGRAVYLNSSLGADTQRVVLRDLKSGREKIIAQDPESDATDSFFHSVRHVPQAVLFDSGLPKWTVTDPAVEADFNALRGLAGGDNFIVMSADDADRTWLIYVYKDSAPFKYYAFDRAAKRATFLFVNQPKLENLALAPMKSFSIRSRDGLALPSYLTLPIGVPARALPLVLLVHGGPWWRDVWGFLGPEQQWLANRGYAVLSVNFRGSTGFGKKFLHAGDKQWGLAMHTDLLDAVAWAVKEGIADPGKVAIMGTSYGGYAALAGAAFSSDVFRCAVDIVGPSNLFTLIKSIPPYWKPVRRMFDQRMGNTDDAADKELLTRASPLFSAKDIRIPLLIGQGANDPRVNQAESEQIVGELEKNGLPVTYVLYPDEGHGFARPENQIDFSARAEQFLGGCLGGRVEPLQGEKIPGSTAVVRTIPARGQRAAPAAAPKG